MSSGQDGSGTEKSSPGTTATATTAEAEAVVVAGGGVQEEDVATVSRTIRTLLSRQDFDYAIKEERRRNKHQLFVLKFTAKWCGTCRKISPFYRKLINDPKINMNNNNVTLFEVDVDESPDLTNFYGASSLPLFVFFIDGKKIDTLVGAQQTVLKKKILKHSSSASLKK